MPEDGHSRLGQAADLQPAPTRKEYYTKVVGLESHAFDVGNAKYMQKSSKNLWKQQHLMSNWNTGEADMAKATRDLILSTVVLDAYPTDISIQARFISSSKASLRPTKAKS
jgi:hypothetical protein